MSENQSNENRTTPFGLWRYGDDFRKAAIAVASTNPHRMFMPYYFLVGQSIELSLKAFLLTRGLSLKELKGDFGHDLKALLQRAQKNELRREVRLDTGEKGAIDLLGYEYLARRFQYIKTGTVMLPESDLTQSAADKLSNGLEECCRQATTF